jgi:hypothetical protein
MKMPMLLTTGYLVDPDKPVEEGEPFVSHVRLGPSALAIDLHVPNEAAAEGDDVYAVLIPLAALYQLFEVAEQYIDGSLDMAQPSQPRKDLLN